VKTFNRLPVTGILVVFIALCMQGCFIPWIGGNGGDTPSVSVFDKSKFLEVKEYDFPEYKWNNNAKFAEEMYAKAMADYFFTRQYERAVELFDSAKKVYPKEARIYVRLIECFARMNMYQEALDVLGEANQELKGFGRIDGINEYRSQLTHRLERQQQAMNEPEKPLWKKILFAPAKLWPF
jgi:tetratricopeptide (TPR) repeat protein